MIVKKFFHFVLELLKPGADSEPVRHDLASWVALYEHRMQLGQKELFHIEALIARVMSVLKGAPGVLQLTK